MIEKRTDKVIGIYGWSQGENSWGTGKNHLDFCDRFANVRVLSPFETVDTARVDLLYLPGGLDTNPANYGQFPSFHAGNNDVFKEFVLRERLQGFVESGIPVYGVCLGMQQLNTYFGGQLRQHVIYHEQSPGRWSKAHKVFRPEENKNLKGSGFEVNSHHHQVVTTNLIAEDLEILLVAQNHDSHITGDGDIVEAFQHKRLPIIACQFHSEEWYDGFY